MKLAKLSPLMIFMALSLVACSSVNTQVSNISKQQHQVVVSSKVNGKAILAAINQAAELCQEQGKRLVATSINSNYKSVQIPPNYTYRTEVKFYCGDKLSDAKGKK